MAKSGVPDETYQQAVELFQSGMLMKDIVKLVGVSDTSIYKWSKKHGIELKNEHGRRHTVDKQYFEIIDTQEKAYWLGFIYADGCISRVSRQDPQPNRMTINLSAKDVEHVRAFNQAVSSTYPVTVYQPHKDTYGDNPMCKVVINSVEFVSGLQKHGLIPSKTGNIHFPYYSMDKSLYRHFIRGYFDGNGGFNGSFRITTTEEFALSIQEILMQELDFNRTKLIPENGNMVSLAYGGSHQLQKIAHYLYDGATVYLERKYTKFQPLLSQ